ncbi:hypothetical protein [Kitasatospora sp. MBT66]|uniref:phage tail tube protein n=1 Tax=Kitasatospora sp. MBT66 TaxID=1444769 RepID=UPI0005BC2C28|nr:hypothetical protein [Kitasatospora sp. MBT66]
MFQPELTRVATGGALYKAPLGTPLPAAGVTTDLTKWTSLGTFTDDGVSHEFSEDTDEITSWQNGVVRTLVKGRKLTLKVSALESSKAVLETFYGSALTAGGDSKSGVLDIKATVSRPRETYLFEWQDAVGQMWRLYIPVGQVSDVESPSFKNTEAVTWGFTLSALGNAGSLAQWQITDAPVLTAAGITVTP